MPTEVLPEHHSTCKGLSFTKKPTEPEPISKHPVGPQCCSTLPPTGLAKAQNLPRLSGLYPQCWVILCETETAQPPGSPVLAGTALFPEET